MLNTTKLQLRKIPTLAILSLFVAWNVPSTSATIPGNRIIDWTANVAVGVPNGIPYRNGSTIDVTAPPYNADATGATDSSTAIQSAINAARAGDVVLLPEGKYLVTRTINIGPSKDNITIRGAGVNATIIDARASSVFAVGSNSDYQWTRPSTGNSVTSALTKGTTQLQLATTTSFSVGQIISVSYSDQTSDAEIQSGKTPTISVYGYTNLRRQLTQVTSVSPTALGISPGLYFTADSGITAKVYVAQLQTDYSGIEDLTIDCTNGQVVYPVTFEQCYASWIRRVKILNTNNYGIYLTRSLKCEVREVTIVDRKGGGSNGAGLLCGTVAASLIEDNIILNIFPAVEMTFSSMGNVLGYNLMENSVGGTLNTNHAPHNSFNLYEGNVAPNMQCDGYYGGASDDTFYRNWFHGTNLARTIRTFRVSLNRFTRNYSFVGNIIGEAGVAAGSATPYSFGNPNMGNPFFSGSVRPSTGSFWADWGATAKIHARQSDSAGTIQILKGKVLSGQFAHLVWENSRTQVVISSVTGNLATFSGAVGNPLPDIGATVSLHVGAAGFQEQDLDVQSTTYLLGNYNYFTRSIPASEALGSVTLIPSLYRSQKPAFFGSLTWPAFDATNPNPTFNSIPAGHRYATGEPTPGIVSATPPLAPSALSVR